VAARLVEGTSTNYGDRFEDLKPGLRDYNTSTLSYSTTLPPLGNIWELVHWPHPIQGGVEIFLIASCY